MADRIINDPGRPPDQALNETQRVLAETQARLSATHRRGGRALGPYFPRDLMAGDPASPSGTQVAEEELDDDLRAKVNAGGQLLEVVLTFAAPAVPAGTTINIQNGTYVGAGSPATVVGDGLPVGGPIPSAIVRLPASGLEYKEDGRISVTLNGQELERGDGTGNGDADWVSPVHIRIAKTIHPGNQLMVRAPIVPPSPSAL